MFETRRLTMTDSSTRGIPLSGVTNKTCGVIPPNKALEAAEPKMAEVREAWNGNISDLELTTAELTRRALQEAVCQWIILCVFTPFHFGGSAV